MAFLRFTVLLLGSEAFAPSHPDGSTVCSQPKIAPSVRCAWAVWAVEVLVECLFALRLGSVGQRPRPIFDSLGPITTLSGPDGRRSRPSAAKIPSVGEHTHHRTERMGTMIVSRGLIAAVLTAGVSLGLASPASADDLNGTYALNLLGATPGPHTTWIASSTCAPSGGCVAHVTSSSGWSGDAQLSGDQWTMTVLRADGQSCPDGTRHAEMQTWSWGSATLAGQVGGVSTDPTACPETGPDSFTLTKMRGGPNSLT